MKFSQETLDVLNNFSAINESIIIREGSRLNTTSNAGNVMAVAELNDSFPSDAHIYNLNELLNTMTLFDEPEFEFHETHFVITDSNTSMTYYFADSTLIDIPDRVPDASKFDNVLEFTLTEETLKDLLKATNVLRLPDIVLTSDDGEMLLKATDAKNSTSNNYGKSVGVTDMDFNLYFRAENLKFAGGDYTVTVYSNKGNRYIANFVHTNMDLNYWIALEPSSEVK